MTEDPGHLNGWFMATDRGSGSLLEPPDGQTVIDASEQRLVERLAAPKTVHVDTVLIEVELGSDQTMRPERIDGEAMPEQPDATLVVGPT